MMVISLIVMDTCLKTAGTKWEIIGTISMVQVNIYPTNGAKSMASGMLLMATVECWPMSGRAITTSNPAVPWQIRNGSTTKATLVGFTSKSGGRYAQKTMDWFLLPQIWWLHGPQGMDL